MQTYAFGLNDVKLYTGVNTSAGTYDQMAEVESAQMLVTELTTQQSRLEGDDCIVDVVTRITSVKFTVRFGFRDLDVLQLVTGADVATSDEFESLTFGRDTLGEFALYGVAQGTDGDETLGVFIPRCKILESFGVTLEKGTYVTPELSGVGVYDDEEGYAMAIGNAAGLLTMGVPVGGGGMISPSDLDGLALWLDASDTSTLFQDSAGTTPAAANDDPVGLWMDKSGNNHATQPGASSLKPVLKLNVKNGLPALYFDGGDSFNLANLSLMRNVPSYTVIAAVRYDNALVNRAVIGYSTALQYYRARMAFGVRLDSATPVYGVGGRRLDANSVQIVNHTTLVGNRSVIQSGMVDYANSRAAIYLFGDPVISESFQTDGNTSDTDSIEAHVGRFANSYLAGHLFELLIFVPALSDQDRLRAEAYVASKWNISESSETWEPLGAAWCWLTSPLGVRTGDYSVWGAVSSLGDCYANTYNHVTDTAAPVPLHIGFDLDDHANPAFLVRASDGRIMTFYTRHNDAENFYMRVSTNPNDPTAWGDAVDLYPQIGAGKMCTYSQVFQLDGETNDPIYLFYRGYPARYCAKSVDDGITWTVYQLLDGGGERPYTHFAVNGNDRIDMVCTTGHPAEVTCSIYHGYYQGGSWYKSDGTLVGAEGDAPFAPSDFTLVYDGTTTNAWGYDISIDANGHPIIVFATFPDFDLDHRYQYGRWTGSEWVVYQICEAGEPMSTVGQQYTYSGGVCLDHSDPNVAYASRGDLGAHSIYKYVTADGGANWAETRLTDDGVDSLRPLVIDGHDGTKQVVYMRGTYTSYINYLTSDVLIDG